MTPEDDSAHTVVRQFYNALLSGAGGHGDAQTVLQTLRMRGVKGIPS